MAIRLQSLGATPWKQPAENSTRVAAPRTTTPRVGPGPGEQPNLAGWGGRSSFEVTATPGQGVAAGTVPHINQLHPSGADAGYVNGAYNCAATVVAMVARGHEKMGHMSDARLVSSLAEGITTADGTTPTGIVGMLERIGVPPAGAIHVGGYDDRVMQRHLGQGHDVIAQVGLRDAGTGETSAHYVLVTGMTPQGHYIVQDPLAEGPVQVAPWQLAASVNRAPPSGGSLIPVEGPASEASPVAGGPTRLPRGGFVSSSADTGQTDSSFQATSSTTSSALMRALEARNDYRVLTTTLGGGQGRTPTPLGPVVPEGTPPASFAQQVLDLLGSARAGDKALGRSLSDQLALSSTPVDKQTYRLILHALRQQPGIGQKVAIDPW